MTTETTEQRTAKTYEIVNSRSGESLGWWQAQSPEDALDALARDAGYTSHVDACAVTGTDGTELDVVEVETEDARHAATA